MIKTETTCFELLNHLGNMQQLFYQTNTCFVNFLHRLKSFKLLSLLNLAMSLSLRPWN